MSWKVGVFAACLAMLSAPLGGAEAYSTSKTHHRHYAKQAYGCPLHRAVDGTLVDCRGWRLRDNAIGWDNTCFNLDYLTSMYACGGGGNGY